MISTGYCQDPLSFTSVPTMVGRRVRTQHDVGTRLYQGLGVRGVLEGTTFGSRLSVPDAVRQVSFFSFRSGFFSGKGGNPKKMAQGLDFRWFR